MVGSCLELSLKHFHQFARAGCGTEVQQRQRGQQCERFAEASGQKRELVLNGGGYSHGPRRRPRVMLRYSYFRNWCPSVTPLEKSKKC